MHRHHIVLVQVWDTRWLSCLRRCFTSRKVEGFEWHNPSGRTTALEVDSASNRNEYQEYFLGSKGGRCVGLTTLPPSCADCLQVWEPQLPGILSACSGLYRDFCIFALPFRHMFVPLFKAITKFMAIPFVNKVKTLR
jgi:hypothetical protein